MRSIGEYRLSTVGRGLRGMAHIKKQLVFPDFNYQKLFLIENKHDIVDQHPKIHQKVYFSLQNISIEIFTLSPYSVPLLKGQVLMRRFFCRQSFKKKLYIQNQH